MAVRDMVEMLGSECSVTALFDLRVIYFSLQKGFAKYKKSYFEIS